MQDKSERSIDLIYHTQITPRNYTISNFNNSIEYTFVQKLNINTVNLTQFSFYNVFPNVNQFYNVMTFLIAGDTYTVTIPVASYSFWNIFDLLTLYQNVCNTQLGAFGTWTFTLTGNNNKFVTITNSTATPFQLVYDDYNPSRNQLFQYIGFGRQSFAFNTSDAVHTGEFPFNVQTTNNIHVTARNIQLNTEIQSTLATIPVNEPTLNLIQYTSPFYQCNRHILSKTNPYAVQELKMSFLDDLGNPLVMNNNRVTMVIMWERYV